VFRVGAAYVVVAWLIIQVVETIFPAFGFGDSAVRITTIVLAIGLIPALICAWAFELTPEGLKKESDVDRIQSITPQTGKKLDRMIMVVLALALGYFAVDKFVLDPTRDQALVEETAQQARSDALLESYGDRSIAVLPFVDMSANQDQEYMSDGIAEELLNLLARIPDLRVISRSSTFAFKGKDIAIPEVARQLNAAYVLEGSVRQTGDQLRITVQLIEGRSDTHLWSETYDRKLENVFQIQDEISAAVVDQFKLTLLDGPPKSKTMNERAYQELLQARYFWNRRAEGDVQRAREHYENALEISPNSAEAWAGLSWATAVLTNLGQIDRAEGLRLAEAAARKAVTLDPTLSDAHVRLGQAQLRAGDLRAGLESYRKALELNPDDPLALGVNATMDWRSGDFDRSIELFERIEKMDPLSAIWPANRYRILVLAGRYEEALEATERFFTISGNQADYDEMRARIFAMTGRYEEAWSLTEHAPDLPRTLMTKAILLHSLGRQDEAEDARLKLEMLDPPYTWFHMARIFARWSERDRAFEYLTPDRVSDAGVWFVQYDPLLKELHDDPRWQALLDNVPNPMATEEVMGSE
jgi:TolB-like protein/Flp pilus assembly protein TadD